MKGRRGSAVPFFLLNRPARGSRFHFKCPAVRRYIFTVGRLNNIQYLRGVAALIVVVAHSISSLMRAHGSVIHVRGQFGVDLFFVISGLVMYLVCRGKFGAPDAPADYLRKRIARIVPAYWFWTMVCVLLFALTMRAPSINDVLRSLGFVPYGGAVTPRPVLGVGWTLTFEAFFYVLAAAALCFRQGLRLLIAALLVLPTLGVIAHPAAPVIAVWTSPRLLEFASGIGLGLVRDQIRFGALLLPAAALAIVLALGTQFLFPESTPLLVRLPLAVVVVGAAALGTDDQGRGMFARAGAALGDISYGVYLTHSIVLAALLRLSHSWWMFPIAVVTSVGAGLLSYRAIEQPMGKAVRRALTSRTPISVGAQA